VYIITTLLFLIPFWIGFFDGMSVRLIIAMAISVGVMLTWLVYLLSMNKYAFLTATIFSFNPIFWIVNGIYLKNCWKDVEKFKISNKIVQ
jgi:hypothetical protein